MIIETKYGIGDEVWCTVFSKGEFATPQKFKIVGFFVTGTEKDDILYLCGLNDYSTITIEESSLFSSKEESLKLYDLICTP